MEARLSELRGQLVATPVEVVVANHAYGLFELAAMHLSLQPPQLAQARLRIPARAFARYNQDLARWIWPGGQYTLHIGRSSRDLPLTTHITSGTAGG